MTEPARREATRPPPGAIALDPGAAAEEPPADDALLADRRYAAWIIAAAGAETGSGAGWTRRPPPVPPGEVLRAEFMAPHGLTARGLARELGVPPNRVTRILNGERVVTAGTALLLARRFGTPAEFWLHLQAAHDLELAQRRAIGPTGRPAAPVTPSRLDTSPMPGPRGVTAPAPNRGAFARHFQADALEEALRAALPGSATRALEEALGGRDPCACAAAVPNRFRGRIALLFYLRFRTVRCAEAEYRAVLGSVWEHGHAYLIRAAGHRRRLRAMFKAARFPLPDGLPEAVPIWRGTSAAPEAAARRGVAWTLDRRVACWHAMRFADPRRGRPLVLAATVPRHSLLFFSDGRREREVLCFDVAGAAVDGTPEEWARETTARLNADRRREAAA